MYGEGEWGVAQGTGNQNRPFRVTITITHREQKNALSLDLSPIYRHKERMAIGLLTTETPERLQTWPQEAGEEDVTEFGTRNV